MKVSLPEDRALLVQTTGVDDEPISLSIDDNEMAADKVRAREVYNGGQKFSNEERDRILARLYLGVK